MIYFTVDYWVNAAKWFRVSHVIIKIKEQNVVEAYNILDLISDYNRHTLARLQ